MQPFEMSVKSMSTPGMISEMHLNNIKRPPYLYVSQFVLYIASNICGSLFFRHAYGQKSVYVRA